MLFPSLALAFLPGCCLQLDHLEGRLAALGPGLGAVCSFYPVLGELTSTAKILPSFLGKHSPGTPVGFFLKALVGKSQREHTTCPDVQG